MSSERVEETPECPPAIQADGLRKLYNIGTRLAGRTFREAVGLAARSVFRLPRPGSGDSQDETIWALDDVSFRVGAGEAVGIVGPNGAGKSTLLKILARITEPTTGRAVVRGRVASLLELGAGFHAELSGRENIYLYGAILGMLRSDIDAQFESIVAFAEVSRFLDTPLKHYSSGMYVRLAFAVAAHLQAEILLVDEVLAVGDASFQKRCLAKMAAVAVQGRTILFVSHNLGSIVEFCPRALHISGGRLVADGPSVGVVKNYLAERASGAFVDLSGRTKPDDSALRLVSVGVEDQRHQIVSLFDHGERICFRVVVAGVPGTEFMLELLIQSGLGVTVLDLDSGDEGISLILPSEHAVVSAVVETNPLNDGVYYVTAYLLNRFHQLVDGAEHCVSFSSHTHTAGQSRSRGVVKIQSRWNLDPWVSA